MVQPKSQIILPKKKFKGTFCWYNFIQNIRNMPCLHFGLLFAQNSLCKSFPKNIIWVNLSFYTA